MKSRCESVARVVLTSLLGIGVSMAPAWAADLSRYRTFQLGMSLATVAGQVGVSPSEAQVIHRRPALIQELNWRPQPLGSAFHTESVQGVVFSFYDGELFQIAVTYDRFETEGMTADDFIQAISATYGTAEKPTLAANAVPASYGEQPEIVARWQDAEYSFDLTRSSYGPSFKMIGRLKRLEAPAQAAINEAGRLDDQEAPQRDAARKADEKDAERTKLEKARLLNKPKFRQ
jgi:hypothetical protein